MPPKKKKGGKKKKKKDGGELTVEDKYKKTIDEIEALKDQLAIRKEYTRRAKAQSEEWKDRMADMEDVLLDRDDTQRAVSSEMTRQYKTMQTEMGIKMHTLEHELKKTRLELDQTKSTLDSVQRAKDQMEKEKSEEIELLKQKIDKMGGQFERILMDSLDNLQAKIDNSKEKWYDKSTYIQSKNKQTLLEFGLNPKDL